MVCSTRSLAAKSIVRVVSREVVVSSIVACARVVWDGILVFKCGARAVVRGEPITERSRSVTSRVLSLTHRTAWRGRCVSDCMTMALNILSVSIG